MEISTGNNFQISNHYFLWQTVATIIISRIAYQIKRRILLSFCISFLLGLSKEYHLQSTWITIHCAFVRNANEFPWVKQEIFMRVWISFLLHTPLPLTHSDYPLLSKAIEKNNTQQKVHPNLIKNALWFNTKPLMAKQRKERIEGVSEWERERVI